jgi:hypothetical protein
MQAGGTWPPALMLARGGWIEAYKKTLLACFSLDFNGAYLSDAAEPWTTCHHCGHASLRCFESERFSSC